MTACLGSLIYIGKMLWNTGMSVKTINYIKVFSQLWSLFWQICSAAAAKYQYINLISMISSLSSRIYLNPFSLQLYSLRIAAGENSHQLHIIVLTYSSLYATAQNKHSCTFCYEALRNLVANPLAATGHDNVPTCKCLSMLDSRHVCIHLHHRYALVKPLPKPI